jgi:hypothetical protein
MTTVLREYPTRLSAAAVQEVLREIGYVLWLTRKLTAEMATEKCQPVRPEMAEFCSVESGAFAA